jgi:hypothetical protein
MCDTSAPQGKAGGQTVTVWCRVEDLSDTVRVRVRLRSGAQNV